MVDAKAYTTLSNLVMSQAMTLDERLACVFSQNGGKDVLPKAIQIDDVHGYNGMSGYNYWVEDELVGQLYLGSLISGTYVIFKKTYIEGQLKEVYDYYDASGNFFYQSSSLDGETVKYGSIAMDPTSPFINHIYNILYVEYEGTENNFGNTDRIKYYEELLKSFIADRRIKISIEDGVKDFAFKNIDNEILKIEADSILTWAERQSIYKQLRQVKKKIMMTKRRAHKKNYLMFDLVVMFLGYFLKFQTMRMRPLNNMKGLFHRHTMGHFYWFFRTVKQNLGLSIAMAIYGPFTFYFITQPMNPHAMWAVGKVRGAYIDMVQNISGEDKKQDLYQDKIATKTAAPEKAKDIADSQWQKRMDDFKAMQIAYEENMVFAARIGRVEQFETQFNFPLTAEAAWMEMELYLSELEQSLKHRKLLNSEYVQFLTKEKDRTLELQTYVWYKMAQFFLDHPYIVVDQDNEQTERNYYVGRQFIFFNTMTDKLSKYADLPKTHSQIKELAGKFKSAKLEGNSVLDTLKKNSKLFRQEDFFNTDEQRDYMRRQWEVMFLQQNKKQEAASFALQTYTWSIKNAIWIMQTFFSAKRSELALMNKKFKLSSGGGHHIRPRVGMDEYLENMFHNLAMEFISIRKEMAYTLKGDTEVKLRESVINNLKDYLIERDKLINNGVYAGKSGKSKRI